MKFQLVLLVLLVAVNASQSAEQKSKHALVIGIDGVLVDGLHAAATPVMDSLAASGAFSWDAFAGGLAGQPSQQATSSGPGWSSILAGVWLDKHNVPNNDFSEPNYDQYPHFFQRIKESRPDAYLSSIVNWTPINDKILRAEDYQARGDDAAVADLASAHLTEQNPDVLFLHFDEVDGAGHKNGYYADIPAYTKAIARVDSLVGAVLAGLKKRTTFENEEWLIMITTDHGGRKKGHGGQSPEERRIFIIANGPGIKTGVVSPGPGHVVVPSTVCAFLGIPIKKTWGWEGTAFGLHQ